MFAENAAFDSGGDGGGDDDAGENGLIEIADDFLDSESHGRDRCVKGGGNSGGGTDRDEALEVLLRERECPTEKTRDARTDVHCRSLASKRSAASYLHHADQEFTQYIAKRQPPALDRVCDLDFRYAAASRAGDEVRQQHAADETAQNGR